MSLTVIPTVPPSYMCLSTDFSGSGSVTGASYLGATLYTTDTNLWYMVSGSGSILVPLTVGSVSFSGTATVLSPNPVINASYVGQITITAASGSSGSLVVTTGSNIGSATNAGGFLLKPHPANTATVWMINTGGSPLSGYPINAGDSDMYYSGSALSGIDLGLISASQAIICWKKC